MPTSGVAPFIEVECDQARSWQSAQAFLEERDGGQLQLETKSRQTTRILSD